MKEGIRVLLDKRGKKKGQVWFPDYFCNEPLAPLRTKEINLYFYPLNEDLSPDWDRLETMIVKYGSPDIFVLVHYFGFHSRIDNARAFCDKHGVQLLEDCAHVLLPAGGCGQNTAVFSPRKLLPLPEGGLLIISKEKSFQQTEQSFGNNYKLILEWLVLRLVQRMMLTAGISWHRLRKTDVGNLHHDHVNQRSKNMLMFPDKYSLKLLGVIEKGIDDVIEKRRKHYIRLLQAIDGIKEVRPLFPLLPDRVCPYAMPLIVSDGRDAVLNQLNYFGIPGTSWPELPPEISERSAEHRIAIWLQEHIILLPIHQDLSNKQLGCMAFKLREILEKGE